MRGRSRVLRRVLRHAGRLRGERHRRWSEEPLHWRSAVPGGVVSGGVVSGGVVPGKSGRGGRRRGHHGRSGSTEADGRRLQSRGALLRNLLHHLALRTLRRLCQKDKGEARTEAWGACMRGTRQRIWGLAASSRGAALFPSEGAHSV